MSLVIPAVLPKTEREFEKTIERYSFLPVKRIQIDVVDGRFATPASWPYTAPKEFRDRVAQGTFLPRLDRIEYELDLMCLDPLPASEDWLALGATHLVFHAESALSLPRLLASARNRFGHFVTFGIALHVETDSAIVESCLPFIAYIQCMGIKTIGRQGQPFDERVYEKVRLLHARYPHLPIQIDGGVSVEVGKKLVALGASHLVVGSGLLTSGNPAQALASFEALRNPYHP
jgi:ribulose-phosphate 3-epimerase